MQNMFKNTNIILMSHVVANKFWINKVNDYFPVQRLNNKDVVQLGKQYIFIIKKFVARLVMISLKKQNQFNLYLSMQTYNYIWEHKKMIFFFTEFHNRKEKQYKLFTSEGFKTLIIILSFWKQISTSKKSLRLYTSTFDIL